MCRKTIRAAALVSLCCWTSSVRADLIHQWEFEDSFEDSVGGLDGAPIGNASITDDARVGDGALNVGGGGDYVQAPDSVDLRFTAIDSYTVTAWVKAAPSNGWRGVVTKGRESPPWYGIWIDPGSRWLYGTSGNNLAGSAVQFDSWVHTAVVQDGEAGTRDLYVDGEIVAAEIARDAFNFGLVYFGGAGGVNEWFIGQIDEVRIYDEALDADGILESMALPPPDCADGPDTHCEGFTVTDADGNAVSAGSIHPSGSFTVEVQAGDDSGEPIRYTLSVDNGVDPPGDFASAEAIFQIPLRPGTWTLSVTVDDKPGCDDVALDNTCVGDPFTVEPQGTELVHRWDFEEDFADSVGTADGIPMVNAEIVGDDPAIGDGALNLTGFGDHVLIDEPVDGSLRFTEFDSYSLTAWVKEPFSTGGWRGIVTKGRENPPWYGLWIDTSDRWHYGTNSGGLPGTPVQADVWTHLAVVQNGAFGTREIWVNGVLEGSRAAADADSVSPLFIGGAGGIDEWFTGQVDDVRIYLGPLDGEGVARSMEDTAPEPPGEVFKRGDVDGNGKLEVTDPINNLSFQFLGSFQPLCLDACDFDDNGRIEVTDPINNLSHQFVGGPAPGPPGKDACGVDPTPDDKDSGDPPGSGPNDELGCTDYPVDVPDRGCLVTPP